MPNHPEYLSPRDVRQVTFDDRLLDMENDFEMTIERDRVDAFWSNIYNARLPELIRVFMHEEHIPVHDLVVIPTDYNLDNRTINLLLHANWDRGGIIPGYSMYSTFKTDGTFVDERSTQPMEYSPGFIPHIEQLLARTALNYVSLDDGANTRRNQV